jgi:hypothetical protein
VKRDGQKKSGHGLSFTTKKRRFHVPRFVNPLNFQRLIVALTADFGYVAVGVWQEIGGSHPVAIFAGPVCLTKRWWAVPGMTYRQPSSASCQSSSGISAGTAVSSENRMESNNCRRARTPASVNCGQLLRNNLHDCVGFRREIKNIVRDWFIKGDVFYCGHSKCVLFDDSGIT